MAQSSDPTKRPKPGPWPPGQDSNDAPAMPPSSWAKRTGFRPRFSGETNASDSGQFARTNNPSPASTPSPAPLDLEAGRVRPISAVNGTAPTPQPANAQVQLQSNKDQSVEKRTEAEGSPAPVPPKHGVNGHARIAAATETPAPAPPQPSRRAVRNGDVENVLPQVVDDELVSRHSHMKYELRDTPGLVPIGFYGFQHYLSMLGSLVLIPLVIVPAMGGDHEDTSMVVSTVLLVSGMTTLLQANFGSRLPLIQGPSFVFLAPALAIIKSPEFLGLNGNNFKHIMKELQGAIIIASAFQALLGYSGLMTLLLRLINPVVVSPTIAAVGLSFYSYGFPQMGACLEIGMYLRKVSVLGHRVFLIYAVPLGLVITWAMAFLLTEAGAYKYDGCDVNIPTSNMISDHCRKHVARMKSCRVDTSHALKSSPWFRFPYPLQWGTPVFNWKMALVMCMVSVISSVDSVGSYHASSLLVASRPPTPGVVSRGIGLEGLSSILAGLWGTGTGSTSLTENVHTIAVTKMGSRRAVELGACVLIILSLVGLLCIMWAMLAALGLSNLRYSEAGSSRNIIIIGLSLFFSLSVPAYFQQYGLSPNSNSPVPAYFQPYIVASHGPFRSQYRGATFLVAVVLDNTVPGSRQERGVYVWSEPEAARREPAVAKDYGLPFRVGKMFRWVRWVGV
ncbi:Xanthine/uracil/vitamin C permease [Cynara cardunculus var. scolymus]|uniref:Xanthine/uracil/vitamin C permease n=1 Tax=Cynara cardunculus var. scolymus TaxID=59895 RepID=A0A103YHJ6_CYNCS|nr:Xanthine/uracil/vitamin C permease [Cynara cardunculus var. scolymus]